jgi:glycosyltransferase involved in cell wall biosynthesis
MIISPIATGNGAFVVHKTLERCLSQYKVIPYHPYRTLFPLSLMTLGRFSQAKLIHTTPDYAIFHKRFDVPLVITFHNYVLDSFMNPYSSALQRLHYRTDLRWFTSLATHQAHTITAVSRFTAELVKRELELDQDIQVIYNGVNEQVFTPAKSARKNSNVIKVLFCGNLTRRKGLQWLLPIADKLNTGIEILYTSGMRDYQTLIEHPRLRCIGMVSHEDMPAVYQQADILLFPTVREGLSLAAIEAMACGLPLVASDCSSLTELIDESQGGYLCTIGDVQSFADKINQLANDAPLRSQMGQYNRVKVEEKFTLKNMLFAYQGLFERTINS